MVGSSKILTVSYGTFSCTLEGFDDSFGTMKAIAEYFRDLASDDRYFGAVPPTPDAAMLTRIAEREIANRVEARMAGSSLVLRAGEPLPQVAPAVAAEPVAHPVVPAADAAMATSSAAIAAVQVAGPTAAVTVAAGPSPAGMVASVDAGSAPALLPDTDVEEYEESAAAPALVAPRPSTAGPLAGSDVARPDPLLAAPRPAVPDPAPAMHAARVAPTLPAHPDSESIAAKLQRIRAVVGKTPAALDAVADEYEAESLLDHYDPAPAAPEAELPGEIHEPADIDALIGALGLAPAPTEAVQTPPVTVTPETPAQAPVRARVIRMRRADFDRAVNDGTLNQALPSKVDQPATGLSPMDEAALLAELAAVEQDLAPTPAPEPAMDLDLQDLLSAMQVPEVQPVDQMLDEAEDDADLAVALSDLDFPQAEPEPAAAEIAAETDLPDTSVSSSPRAGRDILAQAGQDDAALDRILSQTDARLNDPEALGRRAAITQLKAAVAATEAARQLGEDGSDAADDPESAFRDDLREVVRPRRPVAPAEARSERPRPAPLKLVASQRIDIAAPAPVDAGSVRPRRIIATTVTHSPAPAPAAATATSFAAYAADMGATNLADLLEAAAAYTAFVEGSEDFSRPQLMTKLSQVSDAPFSREDTLRSFGTLLREGRITRAQAAGRFQVSDQTRFHPERRAG